MICATVEIQDRAATRLGTAAGGIPRARGRPPLATPRRPEGRPEMCHEDANGFHRFMRSFAATRPVSWLFARTLHHVDRPVFRLTGGAHTFASLVSGLPVVMLTTEGARSGKRTTLPLLGLPHGEETVVIASNYGRPQNPSWYHNLRANPEAELSSGGKTRRVLAREAEGEERERLWQLGLKTYPGWNGYKSRAGNRRIPVMVLSPKR